MGRKVRNWYCGKVFAWDAQYSYNGKLVKYSYASGKVVTLTHCDTGVLEYGVTLHPVFQNTSAIMYCG